jgi:DNA replication protein DnaC
LLACGAPKNLAELALDGKLDLDPKIQSWLLKPSPASGLFLYGPPGRGKTAQAVLLLYKQISHLMQVAPTTDRLWYTGIRFARADSLFQAIRGAFTPGGEETEGDIICGMAVDPDLLVIDDLGCEKVSAWSAQTLASILAMREALQVPTVITSNFAPEDITEMYGTPWGAAIASRLAGMCEPIRFTGPDRRKRTPA